MSSPQKHEECSLHWIYEPGCTGTLSTNYLKLVVGLAVSTRLYCRYQDGRRAHVGSPMLRSFFIVCGFSLCGSHWLKLAEQASLPQPPDRPNKIPFECTHRLAPTLPFGTPSRQVHSCFFGTSRLCQSNLIEISMIFAHHVVMKI